MANEKIYTKVGKMVNTVRTLNDSVYQSVVPVFKEVPGENPNTTFLNYGTIITGNSIILNKFISVFQDIVLYESFKQHVFDNPFSRRFKKESDPLRRATFETFVNPIVPLPYDGEALDRILKIYKRDVKKVTFVRNREDLFPVSINPEELMSAFQSMDAFWDFYTRQWSNLADSNAIVEYNDIKQCFNLNYAGGALKYINIHGMTIKEINTLLKSTISKMSKPSSNYNNYINLDGATGNPVITHTPKESIIFMPDADLLAKLDTEVMASAYNLPYAEVTRNILDVDDFGYDVYDRENQTIVRHENSIIKGVLCDELTLKFDENLNKEGTTTNPASLTQQTFWHVWQTIALRPFCNCVVLIDDGEEPTPVEDSFKLVNPGSAITIENGEFTLQYKGTLPETFENFKCQAQIQGESYNSNELLYDVKSVDEENKTITFKISGEYDGIKNGDEVGAIVLINVTTGDLISGFITTLVNVPVKYYNTKIVGTDFDNISDVTADTTVNIKISPNNVSPVPTITEDSVSGTYVTGSTVDAFTATIESGSSGYYFVIPANTFEANTEYVLYITIGDNTFEYTFTTPA